MGADEVERHETHVSVVVLAGRVVYKLKKPVVFDWIDYGTPERRLEMCLAEVELNRRLAPRLYLGVAAVVEDGDELRMVDGIHEDALEHVVLMERVDEDALLHTRLGREDVPLATMREIGRIVAEFHLGASPAPEGAWSAERISHDLDRRFAALRWTGSPLDPVALDAVDAYLRRWLDVSAAVLERRERDGWIRDGHGDLRTEHVVLADPIQIIDCVEFNARLRQTDVLSDLAFLVMEVEYTQRPDLSAALREAWAAAGGPIDEKLLWVYASMRALIRVEVALHRAIQLHGDDGSREERIRRDLMVEHAHSLLQLAEQLTWRARDPAAILIGGLSGSGKTTVAAHLERRWGIPRLSSDAVRKATLGLRISEIAPPQAYEDTVSLRVYETLGKRAGAVLERGQSVLVDATFRRESDCQAFQVGLAQATSQASTVVSIGLTAMAEALRERVENRERTGGSDATLDLVEQQLLECPWRLPVFPDTIAVSTDGDFADAVREIDRVVLERTLTPPT